MFRLLCVGLCLFAWTCSNVARAQDDLPESGIEYPLQLFHISSIDRILEKADALFLAADRPELSDVMHNWFEKDLKGLKGIDRTRPLGMMVYIKPGLEVGLSAFTYIPVGNRDELLQLLAGNGTAAEVAGETKRYELRDTGWSPDCVAREVNGYLFLGDADDPTAIDRRFPKPERLVSKLTSRYDIAYSLLLKNIPPATRTIFLEFFKNQSLAGLQQRDGEPDAAYAVRRANGEAIIDFLDKVVNQGEELTVGGFANLENETLVGEFELNGSRDSGLAKFFQSLAGRRSYFDAALHDAATFTLSTSLQLDEKRRQPFIQLFRQAPEILETSLKADGLDTASISAAIPFFQSLERTAEEGQMDLFLQMAGTEPLDYSILGGMRMLANGNLPEQLEGLLKFGKDQLQVGSLTPRAGILDQMKLRESELAGHPVHLIPLPPGEDAAIALFGPNVNLYLCATPQALWFAVGGDAAKDRLRAAVTAVHDKPDSERVKRPSAPFLFSTHAMQWISVGVATGAEEGEIMTAAMGSFEEGNDALVTTGQPTETGVRIRTEMQSGYFDLLGRMIGLGVDEQVERTAQRQRRRREREREAPDEAPPVVTPPPKR